MVKHGSRLVATEKIASTDDVLWEIEQLDSKLDNLELGHFQLFNTAYRVVTQHIQHAIRANYFKDPELIDRFVVSFAGHYFTALNATVSGEMKQSSPWAAMGEYANLKSPPIFLSLLIGANAHINYDLPEVLTIVMRHEADGEELKEIATLNKILMDSGKEIVASFDEPNHGYDFLKRRLRFLYYRPAMYTILYWRIVAWKNYRRLRHDPGALSVITKRSSKIAGRLLRASRTLRRT